MTPTEIKQLFNQHANALEQEWQKKGISFCLNKLGQIIDDMQNSGLDISLHIASLPSSGSFELLPNCGESNVPISGYIKIGTTKHLFSLAERINGQHMNKLFFSLRDVSEHRPGHGYMVKEYNFKNEAQIEKFQQMLIRLAARHEAMMRHDHRKVFNVTPEPKKPYRPLPLPAGRIK